MFYRTFEEFTAGMLGFARGGASAGEPVLVAAAGPNLRRLRARLDGLGGLAAFTDLTRDSANPRRLLARLHTYTAAHPGQPVRCVQEPARGTRPPDELREAIRHEALVNLALAGRPVAMLCAYHTGLDDRVLAGAQQTHPLLARDGGWQPNPACGAGTAIPAGFDEPLGDPPPTAAVYTYRGDLGAVRFFAAQCAMATPLPSGRIPDLILSVGELAANTLKHTHGPGTCTIWATGSELICQISDQGQISDPLAGTQPPGPDDPGTGRGLWLVSELCDLTEIRSQPGRTTIRLHLRFTQHG
jgi:anti-sigma regulatory factor (Ser/Thr protein kinase)